jgi:hypothetical protein
MYQLGISEILEKASGIKNRGERVKFLRQEDTHALRIVLQYALHPGIKWLVGPDLPPFHPDKVGQQETILLAEARRLYLFIEGGNPNLTPPKREHLFIQLLEMLCPGDVRVIEAAIKKSLPYPNLEYDVIKEAFPDLLPDVTFLPQIQKVEETTIGKVGETVNPDEFRVTDKTIESVLNSLPPKQEKPKRSRKKKAPKEETL